MPKIQAVVTKKTGQIKYQMNLPKEVMTQLAANQGDILTLKSVVGNELTFTFTRAKQ